MNKYFTNSIQDLLDKIRQSKSPNETVAGMDVANVQGLKFETIWQNMGKLVKELHNKNSSTDSTSTKY